MGKTSVQTQKFVHQEFSFWNKRIYVPRDYAKVTVVEGISQIALGKAVPFKVISDAIRIFKDWWKGMMMNFKVHLGCVSTTHVVESNR